MYGATTWALKKAQDIKLHTYGGIDDVAYNMWSHIVGHIKKRKDDRDNIRGRDTHMCICGQVTDSDGWAVE